MFDWERVLTQHHIEYKPGSGANIETHCPWCGPADNGKHLSISLEGHGFRCWRRPEQHSGKSDVRLLMGLLNVTVTDAKAYLGYSEKRAIVGESFADGIRNVMGSVPRPSNKVVPIKKLAYPEEFRPITAGSVACQSVFRYLVEDRRYSEREAEDLCRAYDLQTAVTGPFRYRVVIPFFMPHMGLVNFTARSITHSNWQRYITLTTDPVRAHENQWPTASMSISNVLWNYDDLQYTGGNTLIVCEGPFDALRLDYFGFVHDIRATCICGKNISEAQIDLLTRVRPLFDHLVIVFDQDAQMESLAKLGRLSHISPVAAWLPAGVKDPAEFSHEGFNQWISSLPK